MKIADALELIPITRGRRLANEIPAHSLYESSQAWVPTVGMRLAPEVLVLELFREVCFGDFSRGPSFPQAQEFGPDTDATRELSLEARAAILALRGRAKQRSSARASTKVLNFFAPAYPQLAAFAWARDRSDRALRDCLLRGALGGASMSPEDRHRLARRTVTALYGRPVTGKDILAVALKGVEPEGILEPEAASNALASLFERGSATTAEWFGPEGDRLSRRIVADWEAVCELEARVPRLEWIQVLKAFLRIASGSWLLGQMRLTVEVRNFLFLALREGRVDGLDALRARVAARGEGLLVAGARGLDPIASHVSVYMKSRIELNGLLHALCELRKAASQPIGNRLSLFESEGSITVMELARTAAELDEASRSELYRGVLRIAEGFAAWAQPDEKGQGSNIAEFLLVLTNDKAGQTDDAFVLEREPARRKSYRVVLGPRALSVLSFLAGFDAGTVKASITVSELQSRAADYGIDHYKVGYARAALVQDLERLGLLRGVPDAGEAARVTPEYSTLFSGAVNA